MRHQTLEDLEDLLRPVKTPIYHIRDNGKNDREKEVAQIIKEFVAQQKELQTNLGTNKNGLY